FQVGHALVARPVAKQPLERELRVVLGRERLVRRLPREVVFIRARITRIAFARLAHHVAGELERGEARLVADLVGDHLVDGHAGADVRARGLLDAHAREEGAARTRVIAGAIDLRVGADVVEAGDDLQLFLDVHERRERGRQREVRATVTHWPPGGGDRAV